MASQDAWARPLAKELVDVFRVASLTYVRVEQGSYDPATGDVVETETSYPGAGAVLSTNESEGGGVAGTQELEVWIDMQGIGDVWPTTRDRLEYLGKTIHVPVELVREWLPELFLAGQRGPLLLRIMRMIDGLETNAVLLLGYFPPPGEELDGGREHAPGAVGHDPGLYQRDGGPG